MVKKLQKMAAQKAASPAGLFDSQLAQTVKDSAQQIWLAGLGAFAKAQGEGMKRFETLIKEGTSLHRKTQAAAGEKLGDMAGKMSAMAGEVGHKANAQWDKLESIFEERTARAMSKLGVPTAKDVAALTERVDALAAAVTKLGGSVEAPAKKAARKAPAKKAAPAAAPEVVAKPAAKRRVARKAAGSSAA
ncbi:phasin family protein [Aquabacterium sp.]|uniref:phasin family protein n=1 Tax=Aquabacterium sp. TaxID=1872578 RepID=UPI003782EE5B